MLRTGLFLLTALLMNVSSFCQDTYPKVLLPESRVNDTVVAVTLSQMDSINSTFIWNTQLRVINDSLLIKIDSAHKAFNLFHHSDSILRTENSLYQRSIADRDVVIANQQLVITDRNKTITRLKVHKGLLAVADAILIGVIACILIF